MTASHPEIWNFDYILQHDETIHIQSQIESFNIKDGITVYKLKVYRLCFVEQFWYIFKRYSDFHLLHAQLEKFYCDKLRFPPKKLLGNKSKMFLIQRMDELQKFVDLILNDAFLSKSLKTRQFFDSKSYNIDIYEIMQRTISGTLCTNLEWGKFDFVDQIGWRIRKKYFRVFKRQSIDSEEYLGHFVEFGPYKTIRNENICSILQSIQHTFLSPIEYVTLVDDGLILIRKIFKNGSVRDKLNNNKKIFNHFLKKYSTITKSTLSVEEIQHYSKQILLVLNFMQEKNIIFGHLHCGNIMIDEEQKQIRLVDFENGLIGIPSFYQELLLKSKLFHNLEAVNVYCFGHVLYEMTFGKVLPSLIVDLPFESCDLKLHSILTMILSKNAFQSRLPTVKELLQHSFFREVTSLELSCRISRQYCNELLFAFNRYQIRLKEIQIKVARKQQLLKEEELSREIVWKPSRRKRLLDRSASLCSFNGSISSTSSMMSLRSPQSLHSAAVTKSLFPTPPPLPPPLPTNLLKPPFQMANGFEEPKPKINNDARRTLLDSINNFNRSSLKKVSN